MSIKDTTNPASGDVSLVAAINSLRGNLRVQLLQCEKQSAVQKGRIKIADRPEKTLKDLKTNHKTDRPGGNPQGFENRS